MDLVSPILDIVSRVWNCSGQYVQYIRHLEEKLRSLSIEKEKLMEQRNDVQRKVETAERQQMQRLNQVAGWLQRVEEVEKEVEAILQKGNQEIQNKCLCGLCPKNCVSVYKLGKQVVEKLQNVSELKNEGRFGDVAYLPPPPLVDERPLDEIVGMDSKFEEVWSYLRDHKVGIIGIYGIGGVGKTTLLTKINNELAKNLQGFDAVLWAVVSRDPNIENVQDKIWTKLGFPDDDMWSKKSQDDKAIAIFKILNEKRFVLLLDDIWDRFILLQAGVPLPSEQNKSKVVFTTRQEDVCGLMGSDKKIKVECLPWKEAWDLFQNNVGVEALNSHPDILGPAGPAQAIAKECAGLPLVLKTVGLAMSSKKTLEEWRYALHTFSRIEGQVFFQLKFSYDSLPDDTIKKCFLYCALFPEDWYMDKYNLINFWIGEGFFDHCDDITYDMGHDVVGRLKLAGLLESGDQLGDNYIKMHDVIRDMALWIVSEYGMKKENFFVQVGIKLTEAPPITKWEDAERVSLMRNSIEELNGTPRCPNLITFYAHLNSLKRISDSFFQFMPCLKVLDLSSNINLTKLPKSFVELVSLQHLDLSYSGVRELPSEFKNLRKLKRLYLNNMDALHIIPQQVLSSLTMLKRLDLFHSGVSDQVVEGSVFSSGNEELLDELENLNELQSVSFTIKSEQALQKFLSSRKLQSCTYGLNIELFRGSRSFQLSSLQNNTGLTWVQIGSCNELEELIVDWVGEDRDNPLPKMMRHKCFVNLSSLIIKNCRVLKDLTWLIGVPNLSTLNVERCETIKEIICSGNNRDTVVEENLEVFSRLQRLELYELPQLTSIYPHALPFPFLRQIHVFECPKLKKLPFNTNTAEYKLHIIAGQKAWLDGLQWEDEAIRFTFLPFFRGR